MLQSDGSYAVSYYSQNLNSAVANFRLINLLEGFEVDKPVAVTRMCDSRTKYNQPHRVPNLEWIETLF